MKELTAKQAYTVAATSGAILWLLTTVVSGQREAWDSSLYGTVAYPIGVVVAGALGYLAPDRPWRWALALMLTQALVLAVVASSFGLLPLGLIMFAVMALPPMGVATLLARARRRQGTR